MHRPIGVTLLAIGAGLAALYEVWRILVFLGIASFTFIGKNVSFPDPQWGQALWALILAAIWVWVAMGFWNVRAYAWTFGVFISLFTLIFGFMALLFGGSSFENETIAWLLAGAILLYLYYPGVRNVFMEHEMSLLTPEQRAAMAQLNQANMSAMQNKGYMAPQVDTAPAVPPATPPAATPPAAAS